jgi:hypothetical protein
MPRSNARGIPCQAQVEGTLQVEGANGWEVNHWQQESSHIYVRPNRVFRLWVGYYWMSPEPLKIVATALHVSYYPHTKLARARQTTISAAYFRGRMSQTDVLCYANHSESSRLPLPEE